MGAKTIKNGEVWGSLKPELPFKHPHTWNSVRAFADMDAYCGKPFEILDWAHRVYFGLSFRRVFRAEGFEGPVVVTKDTPLRQGVSEGGRG